MIHLIKWKFDLGEQNGEKARNYGRWRHFYEIGGMLWWLCGGGVVWLECQKS